MDQILLPATVSVRLKNDCDTLAAACLVHLYGNVRRIGMCDLRTGLARDKGRAAAEVVVSIRFRCRNKADLGNHSVDIDPGLGLANVHFDRNSLEAAAHDHSRRRTRCDLEDSHCTADTPGCMMFPGCAHSLAIVSGHSYDHTGKAAAPGLDLVAIAGDIGCSPLSQADGDQSWNRPSRRCAC